MFWERGMPKKADSGASNPSLTGRESEGQGEKKKGVA